MPSASQPISLSGQTAVVTGGSRGIGRAIALKLAAAGARIAVLARSARELAETVSMIQQAGGVAQAVPADVSSAEAVHKAFQGIEQSLGPVDLLVNNAAAIKPFGPFWETDLEEWWRTMEVNVRGPLLCSQCVLPGMVARSRGRIINIVSGAGAVTTPYYTAYVTSKAALIRFTECVALEAREHGVALFSVSPGTVRTAMTEYSLTSTEGQKWLPWFRRIFDENINVPAERPAELVLELASGRVDALSGRMVSIYDDLDAMLASAAKIEEQNLYVLKMDKLPTTGASPAVGAILAAAREVAYKREK